MEKKTMDEENLGAPETDTVKCYVITTFNYDLQE